jgi:probable F420-dependent oxidoreductase
MEFGVVVPSHGAWADPGMIREAVRAAEDLGYETVWFGDHVVIPGYTVHLMSPRWYDPLSCMLVGAGATGRLRLGSDVLVAPYRHPVVLSQLLAGADQLCGGRLTLGVGVGYISGEFAALGVPYDTRGAMTDEYLHVLRLLWGSDGAVSFAGRWVSFDGVHAAPPPLQSPFPVWVGGNGRAGRRRAALLGSGWHPLFPTPEDYAIGRADIVARREAAGAREPFTFSLSTAMVRVLLDGEPQVEFGGYAGQADIPTEFGYAPSPPRHPTGRLRFVGTAVEVARDLDEYGRAGVAQVTLRFWVGEEGFGVDELVDQLRRFADHVRPLVA